MNLLEIIIGIVILGFGFMGFRKGFVRKLASMLSLVLSIVLVSISLPYVTEFLKENTPVYDFLVQQCENVMVEQITGSLTADIAGDLATDSYKDMGRDQIKALMEQYGYDSSAVDGLTDEQLEQYKEQYLQQYIDQYLGNSQDQAEASASQPGRIEQMELIDSLPLPDALKELLQDNNNDEGYSSLNVSTFQDYVIQFIATMILNVISFIAAILIVQIFLWIAITALDILAHIPVINFVNHLAGLLLGLVQALFFIWIFFLILSMVSATDLGMQLTAMVEESDHLTWLYNSNLFLQIVLRAASMIV